MTEKSQEEIILDVSIQSPKERQEIVEKILANTPSETLTPRFLEKLTDYIIYAMTKEEKRNKKIITENRRITIDRRERSFEGLAEQLERGEDGIYGMMTEDKNVIFTPKTSITQQDIEDIPELKDLRDSIQTVEEQLKTASGKRAGYLKKQLIEMRQDQYVIKAAYKKPIYSMNLVKSFKNINLDEEIFIDDIGEPISTGIISLFNPKHVSVVLQNYSKIKEDTYTILNSDARWLVQDLEDLIDKKIKDNYPMLFDIIVFKIDKMSNIEIQKELMKKHGRTYSTIYISTLWRNKIPKMIAQQAKEDYLVWYYSNKERGKWKRCPKCGQIKLEHPYFFSKNNAGKNGFYSVCKECKRRKV